MSGTVDPLPCEVGAIRRSVEQLHRVPSRLEFLLKDDSRSIAERDLIASFQYTGPRLFAKPCKLLSIQWNLHGRVTQDQFHNLTLFLPFNTEYQVSSREHIRDYTSLLPFNT